jgi:transposase
VSHDFLKETDYRPHKSQYWLNQKHDDEREGIIEEVCALYASAAILEEAGERVLCCDEKTGIQALERISETQTCQPGRIERREHSYARHGTQCLIANLNVSSGKIENASVLDTRTEIDFLEHIKQTVESDPSVEKWHIVMDQLNTHKSESLVRFIAEREEPDLDLGEKGKSGILQNQETRAEFLRNKEHKVVFYYTPKHSSWMNQVESWFSVISCKYLKRSSFKSKEALKEGILKFVEYFNETMGKAFEWKFRGFKQRSN